MINFNSRSFINSHFFYGFAVFFYSFFINFYYAKLGSFPLDAFYHYDSAYKILENQYPVRDYLIVSGFLVDFLQSLFFRLFGTNWYAYIIHSSLFNFIISLLTYYFFISLKINKTKSLIYTFSFATLAYTFSGTPFVDHHATFFLLIATYFITYAISDHQKKYLWLIIVFLFFLSFFSKQVPAAYAIVFLGTIVFYTLLKNRDYKAIKVIIVSFITFSILLILILLILKINLKDFYIQYLDYPRSIGSERTANLKFSFESIFNHYKFVIFPLIGIFIIKFKNVKNLNFKKNNFTKIINFTIIVTFCLIVIFHQLMTKNQIYIYFLIPILFAVLESYLNSIKFKKYISLFLIIFLIFITLKYHNRYNETRKFHELENVDLSQSVSAEEIDKSLSGLMWINPFFKEDPNQEINLLKKTQKILEFNESEIMVYTHYLFLDSITKKNLNYPNRSFTLDGASMPIKGNKYFNYYKNFLFKKIKKNKIQKVYFFKHENLSQKSFTNYIDERCYTKSENEFFYVYNIICLK